MDRAHRSLLILAVVTVLAAGLLAQAVVAPAGPAADVRVAGSLLLLITSSALLVRVLRHITQPDPSPERNRRRRSK
jgi:hypothetical protein